MLSAQTFSPLPEFLPTSYPPAPSEQNYLSTKSFNDYEKTCSNDNQSVTYLRSYFYN